MKLNKLKKVYIIGIAGSASSAIAELLVNKGIMVAGSDMKKGKDLDALKNLGIKIFSGHSEKNLSSDGILPDILLYSPAITALNINNPELLEADRLGIQKLSWQEFLGKYLETIGLSGITVSGSEGKGTTAGILTSILKDTNHDPLAILGAKLKTLDDIKNTNIYFGNGDSYILEADEYNRNFHNYHPSMNIMINFQYEHPETYKSFSEYEESFYKYFSGMKGSKTLILKASLNVINFIEKYSLNKSHKIILFKNQSDEYSYSTKIDYVISEHKISENGNFFKLNKKNISYDFFLPALPGFMVNNAAGAIIAALKLGVDPETIKKNIQRFTGMIRRFDVLKTKKGTTFITDYGHSPESINHIVREIKNIYPDKKLHLVFQPHLFSRTYNFFNNFVTELSKADRVSLVDIYPAREKKEEWENKVSSFMLYESLKKIKDEIFYLGEVTSMNENIIDKIKTDEIICFMGAGDMDQYYQKVFEKF